MAERSRTATRFDGLTRAETDELLMDAEMALQTLNPVSVVRFELLHSTEAGIQYLGTPRSRNGVLLIWTRRR